MTDLRALETELLTAITAAADEAALEAVRVAAWAATARSPRS